MSDRLEQIDWSKWDSKEDNFAKYRHVKSKLIYGKLPEQKPDVSIMIPTFRRADLLEEAIDSALAQKTQYSFTITIVDNDSNVDQATDDLMQQYCAGHENIIYYRNAENIGMFGNWNRCIELAQADWMCMLHDDDMLKENCIDSLLGLAFSSQYKLICCTATILDERGKSEEKISSTGFGPIISLLENLFILFRNKKAIPLYRKDLINGISIGSATHLIHKDSAIACGGYNESFFPGADAIFYQKVIRYYNVAYYPFPLYFYRISENESLNLATIYASINFTAKWAETIQKQEGKSDKECKKRYWEEAVRIYCTRLDYKKQLDFKDVSDKFKVPSKYSSIWIQGWIKLKYFFHWGLLLFRK